MNITAFELSGSGGPWTNLVLVRDIIFIDLLTCPQPETRQYWPGVGATGGIQATVSDVDCDSLINDKSKSNV